ncbi:Protein CBG22583 [Caenorhabditis briggsae]|uniref:Protein CBG22583 n=1 Tax=Caenorhabditis briggsae TaxID=6238 RepID=A8Y2L9_CAEBR|nr:Protein CBG22583 [Caenorhabditis briggsae]CAP39143.1 Protein CBG22583 [Caenorhabditis briggsae]
MSGKSKIYQSKNQKKDLISGGLEPPTFCVLDRCDNHYTTRPPRETWSAGRRGGREMRCRGV